MKTTRTAIVVIGALALAAVVLAIAGPWFVRREAGRTAAGAARPDAQVHARGVVESEDTVVVGSQIAGIVRFMKVSEGDRVRRGDPLAVLDSGKVVARIEQAEASENEARARLRELLAGFRPEDLEAARNRASRAQVVHAQARDEFERQERLYRKDAATLLERNRAEERMKVAAEELGEATANLTKLQRGHRKEEIEQARARVAQTASDKSYYRSLLADHTLVAPIDGIVVERIRRAGESVDVGTPVLKLINPGKMRVRAELEESDVGKVREGAAVEVTCDSSPGKVFRGAVSRVFPFVQRREQKTFDPVASFDINTQKVYIKLADFSGLTDGMTVTVRFKR